MKAGVFVFSSLLHLECLQRCLARHRRSVNICWAGEWSQDIFTIWHYVWIRNQHSNIPPCCRGLCWISLFLLGPRSAPCLCGSSIIGMIWGPAHLTSSGCILRQCNMRFLSRALIRESIQGSVDSNSIFICGSFLQFQTWGWLWNIIFLEFPQYLL